MSDAPPKFINDGGVRKINPAWKAWKKGESSAPSTNPTMRNEDTSLPVVSNMEQLQQLGADAQATPGYQAAVEKYTTEEVARKVGLSHDQMLERLGQVFAKYEIPMGLLQKLLILEQFEAIISLVDDSGSMGCGTDSNHPDGRQMTRWEEVLKNLLQMTEVLAYIPFPPFHITFLNRSTEIVIKKEDGETPEQFIEKSSAKLKSEWTRDPSGGTPALERIRDSLNRFPGQPVVRYFFGDGVPNGGESAQEEITRILKNRPHPEKNPFTFFSCTNDDEDTEWMKSAEEVAPYCAEYDDFMDESEEILNDQGKSMPYSPGMHIVGSLVGALFEDLDGMDEAAPFTKNTMSELTGYQITDQEYDFYFQEFLAAQARKRPQSKEDKIKAEYVKKWPEIKEQFRTASKSGDIPLVQEYRKKMHEASEDPAVASSSSYNEPYHGTSSSSTTRQQTSSYNSSSRQQQTRQKDNDSCCVIA